jgi:hypothetical protein
MAVSSLVTQGQRGRDVMGNSLGYGAAMLVRSTLNVLRYLWDGWDFVTGKARRRKRAEQVDRSEDDAGGV